MPTTDTCKKPCGNKDSKQSAGKQKRPEENRHRKPALVCNDDFLPGILPLGVYFTAAPAVNYCVYTFVIFS